MSAQFYLFILPRINAATLMETIYDWLLYNTGNAGNYYTILNTQRDGAGDLEVMARSSDFKVVNLFIHDSKNSDSFANQTDGAPEQGSANKYFFRDEQQVITYLTGGKTPESQQSDEATGVRVLVVEPAGGGGDLVFPPAQS